jgi:hypothetical protein
MTFSERDFINCGSPKVAVVQLTAFINTRYRDQQRTGYSGLWEDSSRRKDTDWRLRGAPA